jgi:hypothetical protein
MCKYVYECVSMFMKHFRTRFHIPSSSGSSIFRIETETKYRFHVTATIRNLLKLS